MPSPGHIALVTGLVSSSYFAFANIGTYYFGVMPATARGQTTLPVADRLALWDSYYGVAKFHMAASAVISGLAHSVSAYLTPAGPLRNILTAGAVAGYTIGIYTVFFMLPLNNRLIAILHGNSVKPMDTKQEQHVLDQLDRWRSLHKLRLVLGIVSWLASMTGVLASDSMIRQGLYPNSLSLAFLVRGAYPACRLDGLYFVLSAEKDCVLQAEKMKQNGLLPN